MEPASLFASVELPVVERVTVIRLTTRFRDEASRDLLGEKAAGAIAVLKECGDVTVELIDPAAAKPARTRKPAAGATPAPRTRTTLGKVEKAILATLGQHAVGQTVEELIKSLNGVPGASVRSAARSLPEKGQAVMVDGKLWLPGSAPTAEPPAAVPAVANGAGA